MEKRTSGTSGYTLAKQGAYLLIGISLLAATAPLPPPALPAKNHYSTNVFHFACTSYSTNLESPFSLECVWTNIVTNSRFPSVTLKWDYVNDTNVIGYKLYQGTIAHQYPTNWDAGPFDNITVFPYPSPPVYNVYLKISWKGTAIWGAPDLTKMWTQLFFPTNSFTLTNPVGSQYWRATNITHTNWLGP